MVQCSTVLHVALCVCVYFECIILIVIVSTLNHLHSLQIILRVNCLSTEFSSQKGVTGMPMHFVTDTYEDILRNCTSPVHRAYCKVKMFRDKVIYHHIMSYMYVHVHACCSTEHVCCGYMCV